MIRPSTGFSPPIKWTRNLNFEFCILPDQKGVFSATEITRASTTSTVLIPQGFNQGFFNFIDNMKVSCIILTINNSLHKFLMRHFI